jgi:tetratricopeptide (TPR) repeat protein
MEQDALPPPGSEVTVERAFGFAIEAHRASRLGDAERWYRAILASVPAHSDACHNLGVLLADQGRLDEALPLLRAALESNAASEPFWLSYVGALVRAGQNDEAARVVEIGLRHDLSADVRRLLGVLAAKLKPAGSQPVPADAELEALLAVVRAGNLDAALDAARDLTQRFPAHGFGWKVLGSVLVMSGRLAEAVPVLTIAADLAPDDAEIHNNLGAALRRAGRLDAALDAARMAVRVNPRFAEAYNNLGLVLLDLGRNAEAQETLQAAVEMEPANADAQNNLGRAFHAQGRVYEAEACFRRALAAKPDLAEAHNNQGIVQLALGEYREAVLSFGRALRVMPDFVDALNNQGMALRALGKLDDAALRLGQALRLRPDFAEAHNNLATVHGDAGRLEEARDSYRRAIALRPGFGTAYANLGNVLCELDALDEAADAYRHALELDPLDFGLDAGVYLAVLQYLDGDRAACRRTLKAVAPIIEAKEPRRKNAQTYWRFLDRLLALGLPRAADAGLPVLHVVGDSHSLSAHDLVVGWRGKQMRCKAEWIVGCKQWHFAQGRPNRFRRKFETVLARLPAGSTVLLTIGEIDCRSDEGIALAMRKHPERRMEQIVRDTTAGYIAAVRDIARRAGHRLIVCGVPASNAPVGEMNGSAALALAGIIRTFNQELQAHARAAGMDFIDVFALTAGSNSHASGHHHIDRRHLLPSAVAEAFDKYCIAA